MVLPVDILQGPDGDADLSQGFRKTQDIQSFVGQKLGEAFRFWEGESYLDRRKGFPYFRHVIGHRFEAVRPLLSDLFRRAALLVQGVALVESLRLEFDNRSRELSVFLVGQCTDGTPLPPGPFIVAGL